MSPSLEIRDLSSILVNGQAVRTVVAGGGGSNGADPLATLIHNGPPQAAPPPATVPLMVAEGGMLEDTMLPTTSCPPTSSTAAAAVKTELTELPDSCSFGILVRLIQVWMRISTASLMTPYCVTMPYLSVTHIMKPFVKVCLGLENGFQSATKNFYYKHRSLFLVIL